METLKITLIGGPTALLEVGGLRVLTDPTFDPPGSYAGAVTLTKLTGPALTPQQIGRVDAVLLSHDQHFAKPGRPGERICRARCCRSIAPPASRYPTVAGDLIDSPDFG
jgi:hypothetical protein